MSEFLQMGGYAGYIWPAYGATALVVAGLAFAIWRRGRHLRRRLDEAERAKKQD
ncbi:MAG: heme exporter protein CcmD [Pseudomonadota bacterium]